jgi:hypothetical protein
MGKIRPWNWLCFIIGSGMFVSGLSGSVDGVTQWLFLTGGPLIITANVVDVVGRRGVVGGYTDRTRERVKKGYVIVSAVVVGLVLGVWSDSGESVEILLYSLVLVGGLLYLGYWALCRELNREKWS